MSKVINTVNCFLQSDYNGRLVDYKTNSVQRGWSGNDFTSYQVEVSGMTLSCQANQRIRATPMSIEFNKSVIPVVNNSNNVFFVADLVASPPTLTPVRIPQGNVSCVGDGSVPTDQVKNSLVAALNQGLNNANPAWGVAGNLHFVVEDDYYSPNVTNSMGNLKLDITTTALTIVCVRDTNFPEGQSIYNRSAHNLLGGLLNEVHFAGAVPTAAEIGNLVQAFPITSPNYEIAGRPPVLSPLDHIYLRSRSLLPNGLSQMVNSSNLSSGLIQSDIVCRIPWNEGCNYALAGYGGQNFNKINTQLPPNVLSGYSGDLSQWQWKNQSGKDFSFFVPSNIVSNIQVELTTFQGTPIATLFGYMGASSTFDLKDNGIGAFVTFRFDILE